MLRSGLWLLAALTLACGGGGLKAARGTDAGQDANDLGEGPTREPKSHRRIAAACPSERAASTCLHGEPPEASITQGECNDDSDCTSGSNGRCNAATFGDSFCSHCTYDQCVSDVDCPGGSLCECRSGVYEINTCRSGSCRVDADCGDRGYCSLSAAPACPFGSPMASFFDGYFCHTRQDSCVDDDDCPQTPGGLLQVCRFAAPGAWRCVAYPGCPL